MLRTAAALAVLGFLAAPSAATAGNYISLGVGAPTSASGMSTTANGNAGQIMLGQRYGSVAVEAGGFGSELGETTDLLGLGAGVKYYVPLTGGLELFGKAGLVRGWVRGDSMGTVDSGNGYDLGIGAQLGLGGSLANAALWADFSHKSFAFEATDATLSSAVGGIVFGF